MSQGRWPILAGVDVVVGHGLLGGRAARVDRRALEQPLCDELQFRRHQQNGWNASDPLAVGRFQFAEREDALLQPGPIDIQRRIGTGDVVRPARREEGRVVNEPGPEDRLPRSIRSGLPECRQTPVVLSKKFENQKSMIQ